MDYYALRGTNFDSKTGHWHYRWFNISMRFCLSEFASGNGCSFRFILKKK